MTVDEILATGKYTDRRGREWAKHTYLHGTVEWFHPLGNGACYINTLDEMRLLIERDLHRDECPGLHDCGDHPVHHAVFYRWERAFRVYEPDPNSVETIRCGTLPAAMDAARAWAVGG